MTDELQGALNATGGEQPAKKKARKKPASPATAPVDGAAVDAAAEVAAPGEGARRTASSLGANANPITLDDTYSGLREDNRVVMRHTIALNIESFRAAPDNFAARPTRTYAPLPEVSAPFFSVIVPNYNGVRHLPTVLAALHNQTFHDFEIIVIDDASNDASVALVERDYPDARVLVNRANLGFVRSCNVAADAARGRYLVLLNSDTEPEPGWLAALAHAVVANPDAAIIASKLLLFDRRSTLHTTGDLLGVDGVARNRGVWEEDRGQYDDAATAIFSGCGGASAYRREVWQALGGFDEDFWMYLEDVDYGFRARLLGYTAVFAPAARVYHQLSASGGDTLASFYVGRNTIWLIAKNMPRSLLLRHWRAILRAQVKVAGDALAHWQGEAARARLRGQFAGLLGLPAQLAKRRTIQPHRQVEDREIARALVEVT